MNKKMQYFGGIFVCLLYMKCKLIFKLRKYKYKYICIKDFNLNNYTSFQANEI